MMKRYVLSVVAVVLTACLLFTGCNKGKGKAESSSSSISSGGSINSAINSSNISAADSSSSGANNSGKPSSSHGGSSSTSTSVPDTYVDLKDTYSATTGINNTEIKVRLPGGKLKVVNASQFDLRTNAYDNTLALFQALNYCSKNPNTKLVIDKGTYRFRSDSALSLTGASNIIIDGQGAEFIFSTIYKDGNFLEFIDSNRIQITNLTIDWDWDKERICELVKVINKQGNYVEFEFPDIATANTTLGWITLNQCDPTTFTPGVEGGKEIWGIGSPTVTRKSNNVLGCTGGNFSTVQVGEYYLARKYQFSTLAISVNNCSDMSFKGITVYSSPGYAFLINNGTHHFEVMNCKVGIKPNTNRRISTTGDALHIANVDGYFRVEGCDFSGMGDDNINIDTVTTSITAKISSTEVNVQEFLGLKAGDTVTFRNADFSPTNFNATVVSSTVITGGYKVKFDKELPGNIGVKSIVLLTTKTCKNYVVRNNYFHENRGRGTLLGAGNGLFENNKIYKSQFAAILISVDMYTAWSEGSGVDNLLVRNNEFINTNVYDNSATIMLAAGVADGTITSYPALTNITIDNNKITDCPSEAFSIASSSNIAITNNTISNPTSRKTNKPSRGTIKIEKAKAITVTNNTWISSPYMVNPGLITIDNPGELTAVNNVVK